MTPNIVNVYHKKTQLYRHYKGCLNTKETREELKHGH